MWAWKYGLIFFDTILRANAIRSKLVYLVSAPVNILLTKLTSFYLLSLSDLTRAVLKVIAEVA